MHCPVFDLFWAIIWWIWCYKTLIYCRCICIFTTFLLQRWTEYFFASVISYFFVIFSAIRENERENSKLLLYILNTICLPRPFLSFLHLHPQLPGGAVICPLRGGESVTCHVAPSSYDTRRHSTAVRASTELGSGDQIITLPGSISHIVLCYPENRSHAICMESARRPVALVLAISTTRVQETLQSELADSKVSV